MATSTRRPPPRAPMGFPPGPPRGPYQEGFLALLLMAALFGLVWLLAPFLPGLFLATVLSASTWPYYQRIMARFTLSSQRGALAMTGLVFLLVISPVTYLLTVAGIQVGQTITLLQSRIASLDATQIEQLQKKLLATLPLPDDIRDTVLTQLGAHLGKLAELLQGASLLLFKSVFGNTFAFFSSLTLILFALFFFYRDGPDLVRRIKILSPLPNRYDDFILRRFSALATTLLLSTITVALLQGTLLGFASLFLGLPWFFMSVAGAVTSFIPVIGSFIVWGPTSLYLYLHGHPWGALFLVLWGAVVIGFLVDNILRPVIISRLGQAEENQEDGALNPLSHTLLTVLSTLGGIIAFGILGLFFGPIIAAMAITVFDVYEETHKDSLDRS